MTRQAPLLVGALFAVTLLTACGTGADDAGNASPDAVDAASGPSDRGPSGHSPADRPSSADPSSSQADIRPTSTPREGDCVGAEGPGRGGEVWVVDCANRNAVARVTKLVPNGESDRCIEDDYTGFDFSNDKPSLCLMLYGEEGDCYSGFDNRVARGPRVKCTDPKAVVRLQRIVGGDSRGACEQTAPSGDPNAAALFYGRAPDFDAGSSDGSDAGSGRPTGSGGSGAAHDLTYCLTSPNP